MHHPSPSRNYYDRTEVEPMMATQHNNHSRISNNRGPRGVNTQWIMRLRGRPSRTDSPCVIAMVGFTGILLIIFVLSSAFVDLFDDDGDSSSTRDRFQTTTAAHLATASKLLTSLENATFHAVCMSFAQQQTTACNSGPRHVETVIALSDAGSLGPYVTRHVRQMLDEATQARAAIRLKKVSCVQTSPQGSEKPQAFCAVSLQIDATASGGPVTASSMETDLDEPAWSSNRFVYTTYLDVNSIQPVDGTGRLLALPELAVSRRYAAHPTVFTLNAEPYVSLLSIDVATDSVHHAYLWDVNRSVRIQIRLPAFVSKNWRHFAQTWVPWVTGPQQLHFIFSILPWQALTCAFVNGTRTAAKSEDRYLNCRIDSQTAPVLPKPFVDESGEELRIRDTSLFLPFKDGYYLGYVQLVRANNASSPVSGHVLLVNSKTQTVVAFSSPITPGDDGTLAKNWTKLGQKSASGSFLLFGGMSGKRGVTMRIDGIGDGLDAVISRDKACDTLLTGTSSTNNNTKLLMQCSLSNNADDSTSTRRPKKYYEDYFN